MPSPIRIYFPFPAEAPDLAEVQGEEHHYLTRVLRARPGAAIVLFGLDSRQRLGVIEKIERGSSLIRLTSIEESPAESCIRITLGIAAGKGRKLEEVVEMTTALGVTRIIPFVSERSVAKRANPDLVARLRRIAIESCRQCRRVQVPEILEVRQGLAEALACIQMPESQVLFLDEAGGAELVAAAWELPPDRAAALFIGPEGGWEGSERDLLLGAGAQPTSLGPRILRTELAPIVAVSILEQIASFTSTGRPLP